MIELPGFKILEFSDIQKELEELHKNGWDSGKYVGFPALIPHYNMIEGGCTDWTGYQSSGKTEFLLELLFNTSEFYGWKHLLYVPDIGKSIEIMAKLIHKYTGKTFIKKYPNFIEIKHAFDSCSWLLEHFKIIHKVESKSRLSPVELWEYAAEYKKENELNTIMIDSWKDMFHDYAAHGGSYAQYLSQVLPIRNSIMEQSKLHSHIVIHPKNPSLNPKTLKLNPPNTFDMEGGAQWANSGKCILTVHREDFNSDETFIYFRKIKPESVGRNTSMPIVLRFDIKKSRYYFTDEQLNNIYADKKVHEFKPDNFYEKDAPF